jgi:transposase InsO family protein
MKNNDEKFRRWAVQRFISGESACCICASLGRSRSWLYKWVDRYDERDPFWYQSRSRQPKHHPRKISTEVEQTIKMVRLHLYNQDLFFGAQAILWELQDLGIKPLPSMRTINRILAREGLTHKRTGAYVSKGRAYPKLPALLTNQTHQADLVGPCYLRGPIRFYSLNTVDLSTARCGINPSSSKSGPDIIEGLWEIWKRMGIPDNIQVDNAMSFFGGYRYPRGMGPLIRLCLHNGVQPWFIPLSEPWRNGVVEWFNDHYQQRFLGKVSMDSTQALKAQSLAFEQRHNSKYRYSKLSGKTPLQALSASQRPLRFPEKEQAPKYPMKKPRHGKYHLVRFIRSNLKLNIFGELFPVAPKYQYEYLIATIDVKEQKLKLYLDKTKVDELPYRLR